MPAFNNRSNAASSARSLVFLFGLVMVVRSTMAAGPDTTSAARAFAPDPASVERFGAGYRYPQAGWVVLHIEGEPYERGVQHGRLMAPEIARLTHELARYRSLKAPGDAWRDLRLIADAIFLRRFEPEYLEEMKGIADGAAAAGVKIDGRAIDLLDIVTINADVETTFLDEALEATPASVSSRSFGAPAEAAAKRPPESHCSAFAATGPATADGQVVIGHITMWNLFHSYHYNVWLDVKPTRGHRVLMQTYPGGIMSGLDYYMNDHGIVICETTIGQTRYDGLGTPLADRIRRALQYSESIDDSVRILTEGNNGLYSNEWLLADTRKNEVAMFELGTHKSKLWRSSKNEWFGGTPGFYWGCNNAKELSVRLEAEPAYEARPANVVFHPADRDREWLRLFDAHNKKIGTEFGFIAFTTPPLAASHSLDAKFTTTAMAREMTTWAKFGPPLGTTWEPTEGEKRTYPGIRPLVGNDWTVLRPDAPAMPGKGPPKAGDLAKLPPLVWPGESSTYTPAATPAVAWHGTLVAASDADIWLAAAFADYERIVAHELMLRAQAGGKTLSKFQQEQLDAVMFGQVSRYLTAVARREGKYIPLSEIKSDLRSDEWYDIAAGKGVLLLAGLRAEMGDEKFIGLMDQFGRGHAGRAVTSETFFDAAEKAHPGSSEVLRGAWRSTDSSAAILGQTVAKRKESGRIWSVTSFERDLSKSLIVYGTLSEADSQRDAAMALQRLLMTRWANIAVPVKADVDVKPYDLAHVHVLLVGRPATNQWAGHLSKTKSLPVQFGPASVTVGAETFAHPRTSIVAAGPSPYHPERSIVIFAGLGAEGMWDCPRRLPEGRDGASAEVIVLAAGESARRLVVTPSTKPEGIARGGAAEASRVGASR
jgi:hypothetical protein